MEQFDRLIMFLFVAGCNVFEEQKNILTSPEPSKVWVEGPAYEEALQDSTMSSIKLVSVSVQGGHCINSYQLFICLLTWATCDLYRVSVCPNDEKYVLILRKDDSNYAWFFQLPTNQRKKLKMP